MNRLGDLIRDKRQEKGLSHEKLGKLVDYDRSNILNIEAGKKSPPNDLLERIGKELGIPYKRLIALKILDKVDDEVRHWLLIELQNR
jgi:transcriptional regulator with XRE-family HTH domain